MAQHWQSLILESEAEGEEAWLPRTMMQHALVIELVYSAVLQGGMTETGTTMRDALALISGGWEESYPDLGPMQMGLRSADDAVSAIDEQGPRVDQLLATVADGDLQLPADLWDAHVAALESFGYESSRTVEGLLALMLWHLEVHAKQLAGAPV